MFTRLTTQYSCQLEACRALVLRECRDLPFGPNLETMTGGKMLRALMTFMTVRAAKGPIEDAVPLSAALELLHLASMLHDDVIDGSAVRRGRPALHWLIGTGAAIVTGDVLLFRAQRLALAGPGTSVRPWQMRAALTLIEAAETCAAGELRALGGLSGACGPDDYIGIARAKAGALFGAATSLGAICSGAPERDIVALKQFATSLGVCYQIIDDLADLWEDYLQGAAGSQSALSLPLLLLGRTLGRLPHAEDEAELLRVCRSSSVFAACRSQYKTCRASASASLAACGLARRCGELEAVLNYLDDLFERGPCGASGDPVRGAPPQAEDVRR